MRLLPGPKREEDESHLDTLITCLGDSNGVSEVEAILFSGEQNSRDLGRSPFSGAVRPFRGGRRLNILNLRVKIWIGLRVFSVSAPPSPLNSPRRQSGPNSLLPLQ
jgi:hypothetical protein